MTPVIVAENKTIEATVAESPTMNYLLRHLKIGASLDLSTRLVMLENDSTVCGLGDHPFGSSTPKTNGNGILDQ